MPEPTPIERTLHETLGGDIRVGELAAMLVLVAILVLLFVLRKRVAPGARVVLTTLTILSVFYGGVLTFVARSERWRWDLAGLPALIILNHAIFIHLIRRRAVPSAKASLPAIDRGRAVDEGQFASTRNQLNVDTERYFSLEALLLRYGVPAMFVAGMGVGLSNMLFDPERLRATGLPADAILGAKHGLVGAYIYSLLYLGKRAFRQDITPGAANWVAVTLGAGPVLAAAVAMFVHPTKAPDAGVGVQAVMFFAGFAPRVVVDFVESQLRKNYFGQSARSGARVVTLSEVRGLGLEVQERLSEEGIEDASTLAMADPLRLLRNTAYDKRQIIHWIDAAILATTLPDHARALESLGITGAIDLAWCSAAAPGVEDDASRSRIHELSEALNVSETLIRDVCQRLWEDSQVRLLWLIYQAEDELKKDDG